MTTPLPARRATPTIAPLAEPFEGVERIAVLRGGGLGDLLFALPALDALANAYPAASITLLGTPLARALLDGRPGPVSRVELLPHVSGVHLPAGSAADPAAAADFAERMRARNIDLVAQLHGGGRNSNPFVLGLGARHSIGLATPDAPQLERTLPYLYYQHEVARFLEVAGLAGAAPVTLEPSIPVLPHERDAADRHLDERRHGLVVLHPGATDPRRRWPCASFAEVAARLASNGRQVVVVGDASDRELAASVVTATRERVGTAAASRVSSLAGELDLGTLVGLLEVADVVLGNDSGPRHLALAVGTKTVGVFWAGNLINAGPLGRANHRVELSWTTHCPVCGRDSTQVGWTAERCEHDVSFVADIGVDAVYGDVCELLGD
ncbi:glycosyltransferase family 9 protein [Subtercola sp. Z020]|uniref:glycosyltransferase family 9 protein n=1 Tax=Subtercola sp. Z020 TaxID=2080582 RepID=UPI000CE898B2|nr:glycosyltransferase family 9 protein [Subtercola sp. Z020]PPF87833.1 glycosyltransferase family 9 protein [Subtercola sp. Z020]